MSQYQGIEYHPRVGDIVYYQPAWITLPHQLIVTHIFDEFAIKYPFACVKFCKDDNIYHTRLIKELHKTPHLAILCRMKTNPELKDKLEQLLWTI